MSELTHKTKTMNNKLRDKLKERFPQSALKELYGAANLTAIDGYHVIERLNDALGIGGWRTEIEEIIENSIEEVIVFGRMYINVDGKELRLPDTFGHMENKQNREKTRWIHTRGYLAKGAATSLIGKSASFIEVGIDVYKGLQKHNTPDQKQKKKQPKQEKKVNWIRYSDNEFQEKLGYLTSNWDGTIEVETEKGKGILINEDYYWLSNTQFEQLGLANSGLDYQDFSNGSLSNQ